jgi:hypothetical protein
MVGAAAALTAVAALQLLPRLPRSPILVINLCPIYGCDRAQQCAEEYLNITGSPLPSPVQANIEAMAEYFLSQHQFQNFFLQRLVSWLPFRKNTSQYDELVRAMGFESIL